VEGTGYSRIPVSKGTFDTATGMLYSKDLLPHLDKDDAFRWQSLLRQPYFVPENKKINNLLDEFRERKIHLAVVLDEYGTALGIVALEDILEAIVGEISDGFDDEEPIYSKRDDDNFVFEGATPVTDVCRVMHLEPGFFGNANPLAGVLLEISGRIPERLEVIPYKSIRFTVESSDRRRIKRVKAARATEKKAEAGNNGRS
jgi:CBS domain containing-hemolysin-like protein